ncbi:disintegrin and metalloproteinase domain-containing protein 9 [Zootoca vivipara]|uniref:disintegrin and metalloproteinase domain-containing protein 9 n=1 Tax=Zootoca vivipara TaxID=8524 RepID=UPI00159282D3|nr:disintegrin and metalloproteinase domain-containing protein 9 [Zootoca vivipara]
MSGQSSSRTSWPASSRPLFPASSPFPSEPAPPRGWSRDWEAAPRTLHKRRGRCSEPRDPGAATGMAMGMVRAARSCWLLLLLFGALTLQADRPGFQPLSQLSAYEIIVPKRITRKHRDVLTSRAAEDELSFEVDVEGTKYTLELEKNKALVPKDFTVYTYNADGSLHSEILDLKDHCHYQGYVKGVADSLVAVSTCSGLRGLLQIESISYGIEPLDPPSGNKHVIYRLKNVTVDEDHMRCQLPGKKWEGGDPPQPASKTQRLRRKRGVLLQTRYVELFIVVDKERYQLLGQNKTSVTEEMVHLVNYLDSMYIALNIRIVLVGLEIWTQENKIRLEGGAGDVLANFVQWREQELVPRQRHDSAQFVLKKAFGGTAGMAYVGTVCSKSHAGGINVFGPISVQMFSSIVAHELGHNLGMNHDDERKCDCGSENCIMNSGASGARNFSSCSEEDFEKLTLSKGGSCLLNIPRPEETYSIPYCGNKLVDAGEECDCGTPEECQFDPCCEAGTCRLHPGADCGYGDCCHNCHFLSKGTECRERASECDLPEFCNGTSQFCPPDVTIENGHPCHKDEAYCYNGLCQYYNAQCRGIFGPKAKAAPQICFSEVNSKGDRFGNCGYHGHDYKKCSSWNAMCGKLQCENVQSLPVFGIEPAIIKSPIQGNTCWGVDFQLGSDVPDPGMVNEGTKCAPGKICKHYQCVDVSVLGSSCNAEHQCNGRGVCNSNKNCHCHPGWAPPYCDTKGYGGSLDSGPPYNDVDNTTRNWLLAFFCLILPLLLLLLFTYLARNQLLPSLMPSIEACCGRFRRRSDNRIQESVHTSYPPNIPYSTRDMSAPMSTQANRYPVPAYTANLQPYCDTYHHTSLEQHCIPMRPPPPVLKTAKTQEPIYPSRPAPLPPV